MYGTSARIFLSLLALTLCAGPVCAADYFLHCYYTPTAGKVGQALSSDASFGIGDMPDQCVVVWKDVAIDGKLPPGLDISNSFSSVIAGTPTDAGDYAVTVTFHALGCSANSAGRADRALKVNFHITP
jgi:hypothetical protein